MSEWLNNQHQAAFRVYSSAIAMRLHFTPGSKYDYSEYGGKIKVSMESFLNKPRREIREYVTVANKIKDIPLDRFLFANARVSNLSAIDLSSTAAIKNYREWASKFGTKDLMHSTSKALVIKYRGAFRDQRMKDFILHILGDSSDIELLELSIYLLSISDSLEDLMKPDIIADIFINMNFNKAVKLRQLYSYFCIL
jgi:hypothetical protein